MVDTIGSTDIEGGGCVKDTKVQRLRGYPIQVVSQPFGSTIGNPSALAIVAFATTLAALSCIGMVISSQWELVRGNSYGYTVLSAFGLFYAGFGALDIPFLGITAAYGNDTVQYNNAVGFFVLCGFPRTIDGETAKLTTKVWSVFNLFFLIDSFPINLVYIAMYFFIQFAFTLVSASYFSAADGNATTATALEKTAGAFAFIAGILGYYTAGHLMCQEALLFDFPVGDTSRFFMIKLNDEKPVPQHHERESKS
ncbi:hypothetical protein OCU04_011734 [Sclerotinia nivalis]|uniref:Uncharacterized protein n=1 Tax=Sclerotinia nivalis TaxID=352851 RepID=A0A9X0DFD1_9HELO|nr:hypothetical protein OCU04_011734 [Sclerotinia nivalis]